MKQRFTKIIFDRNMSYKKSLFMKNPCMPFNFTDFHNVNKTEIGLGACCNDKKRKKRIPSIHIHSLPVVDNQDAI